MVVIGTALGWKQDNLPYHNNMAQKVFLFSDTHSFLDPRFLPHIQNADVLWHAGDWGSAALSDALTEFQKPIFGVYGNIDGAELRRMYPRHLVFEMEGLRIGMTHIGGAPSKYKPDAISLLEKHSLDVLVVGHSHILQVKRDTKRSNMLFLNPGAAGKHGFHLDQTALQFQLSNGKIQGMEAIVFPRNERPA